MAELALNAPKKRRFNFRASLCMPYAVFMLLFVIVPLALIVYFAFTDATGHFSFDSWKNIFTSPEKWKVIGMTFVVAASTTFFCILIAYPVAFILSNSKFNKNKILVYIFLLPMWINFVIRTIGLKDLLNGTTHAMFGWDITAKYPYIAIIIGMVYDYLPFAILPLYNQMLKMDKNQIEAAADLGANPFQVFIKTIIPMTFPGIVSACMMTFMPTMSSYVIVYHMSNGGSMIIGSLIELYINSGGADGYNLGSVLSIVMLAIIGVSILVQKLLDKKGESGKEGIW